MPAHSSRHSRDPRPERTYVAPPRIIFAAILFCMLFAGSGAFILVPSLAPFLWKSVPCEVLQFDVEDHAETDPPFTARVRYRFDYQGSTHEGIRLGIGGWKNASTPIALSRTFSKTPESHCYLQDGQPDQAVLMLPKPKWGGLALIGFGTCVSWILIQAHRSRNQSEKVVGQRVLPAVSVFFGAIGFFLMMTMSWPVWRDWWQVGGWREIPATIVWSRIRVTRGQKHTNYRADICYEYSAEGKTWRNNQVCPGNANFSSSSGAAALVSGYPPGLRTCCRLNPSDPARTLLKDTPGWAAVLTLFPLPFLLIGLLCAREAFRSD